MSRPKFVDEAVGACDQLAAVARRFSFEEVLVATGRRCCDRTHCIVLDTAATRGLSMMKLFLGALPDQRRSGVLQEWKKKL